MTMIPNSGIYVITSLESGTAYIGSTIDFERRWNGHRSELRRGVHGNSYLQRSWTKHGENVFEFSVLQYVDNLDELAKVEQFWMDRYREEGKELYNFGLAADNALRGYKRSEESNRKLSESNMGHSVSEETRYKISKSLTGNQNALGYKHSEETRYNMSKARMGKNLSEEHKCNISKSMMGKQNALGCKRSKEYKQRVSEAHAKPYPAFINKSTGEIILAGVNLHPMCRELGLISSRMYDVARGKQHQHHGWALVGSN